MARQPLRIVRGSAAQVAAYTGPMGEIVQNTDTKLPHIQDGGTPGGIALAPARNPSFLGTVSAPVLALSGSGSTGDVSGMSVTPRADAPSGTLARHLADAKPGSAYASRLRNGAFTINQRAVSGTVTLAAGQYGHDGFKAGAGGCTYTFSRASGITTITITAGTLVQVIEGGLYIPGLANPGPTGITYALSWIGSAQGRINGGAYAASPVIAYALGSDADVTVEWGPGTLALPMFEPGERRTDFGYRDDELLRNQRYYLNLPCYSAVGQAINSSSIIFTATLAAAMRAPPSALLLRLTVSAGDFELAVGGSFVSANPSILTTSWIRNSINIYLGGFSGLTAGAMAIWNTPKALVSLSAEL